MMAVGLRDLSPDLQASSTALYRGQDQDGCSVELTLIEEQFHFRILSGLRSETQTMSFCPSHLVVPDRTAWMLPEWERIAESRGHEIRMGGEFEERS